MLPPGVALADRSTTFLVPQTFVASGPPGTPGVIIEGTDTNMAPALLIANTVAPVNRAWDVLARGDTGALAIADATAGDAVRLSIDTQGTVAAGGDLAVGGKLDVTEGQDASVGQVVLLSGAATVTTRAVKTNSRIFLSYAGITGQPGILYSTEIRDGESFEVRSTSPTDDSPVNYWIIN